MQLSRRLRAVALVVGLNIVAGLGSTRAALAQPLPGCGHRPALAIGGLLGLSSAEFSLHPVANGSESVYLSVTDHGRLWTARADVALAPTWRLRVDESRTSWPVTGTSYARTAGDRRADTTIDYGRVGVRQTVVALGRQHGGGYDRTPCMYTLGGVGLYTLRYAGSTLRRPGILGVIGLDLPASRRSRIQAELHLHVIANHSDASVISAYDIPTLGLSVGWLYRF